jgi:uncharacterized protein YjbJ (UPF0337 family)
VLSYGTSASSLERSPDGWRDGGLVKWEHLLEVPMNNSTKDQAEGTLHEVKGKVKEKVGQVTNNPRLQNEGTDEKIGGKVQKKVGQVEKVLED